VVAVQLPEARKIDTRGRIFQVHPGAREQPNCAGRFRRCAFDGAGDR
jgi:hypothetical protein